MSEAIAFDTHRYVKRLTENGFTEQQAETLADEQITLLNTNLATNADVARIGADVEALRQETQAGIEALQPETKADIAKVEGSIQAAKKRPHQVDVSRNGRHDWHFRGNRHADIARRTKPLPE